MVVLETPRLILRRLQPSDLDALSALYRDPEIRQYFPDGTRTREQTKEELEWFLNGHPQHPRLGLWATIDRTSGAFLGRCGLLPWDIEGVSEVEVAFLIGKAHWGQGLATEAASAIVGYAERVLGLQRLICVIMLGNSASIRVAEKVGMSFERDVKLEGVSCHLYSRSLRPRGGRLTTSSENCPAASDNRMQYQPNRPHLEPTQEAGRELFTRNIQGPVVMLNLMRFRAVADYTAAPHLAPGVPITGEAAFKRYMDHTLPFLTKSGGEVLFYGSGGSYLIGPSEERWDAAMLVRQASLASFLAFASDQGYLAGMGHRTAALEDSRLLPLIQQ